MNPIYLLTLIPPILYLILASIFKWFPYKRTSQKTSLGMEIKLLNEKTLDKSVLDELDSHFQWAVDQGLVANPKTTTIHIMKCEEGRGFPTKYSPTGFAWGLTPYFNPIDIEMCLETPKVLRHELLHVIFFQKNGKADNDHEDPSWRTLDIQ